MTDTKKTIADHFLLSFYKIWPGKYPYTTEVKRKKIYVTFTDGSRVSISRKDEGAWEKA